MLGAQQGMGRVHLHVYPLMDGGYFSSVYPLVDTLKKSTPHPLVDPLVDTLKKSTPSSISGYT